ncbi:hypothetical protein QZJ86_01875 [Methylomonas montana]|uniref:hypothetical protein n=1 Tax=Methylomonas montana TaxID=3058963 RepID=UPI0026592ACD|nr:hypothetical protein [Methylomonas montana]WKJ90898.1 hypothetical protein QZJ86_01875 [Methylomonas montana]
MSKRDVALQRINEAIIAIQEELKRCEFGKEGVSNPHQLVVFLQELRQMESELGNRDPALPRKRTHGLGRVIADSWPLGSVLGDLIVRAEIAYFNA